MSTLVRPKKRVVAVIVRRNLCAAASAFVSVRIRSPVAKLSGHCGVTTTSRHGRVCRPGDGSRLPATADQRHQELEALGRTAAELLLAAINGEPAPGRHTRPCPTGRP